MTSNLMLSIFSGIIVFIFISVIIYTWYRNKDVNRSYFQRKWKKLEKLCSDKKAWCQAVIDADDLLNEALRKKHFKGKTVAERLVSAQREFSSNHSVWFGHKLRTKIDEQNLDKLNKKEAKLALTGFHKALIDLDVISASKTRITK